MSDYNLEMPMLANIFNPYSLIKNKGKGIEWIDGINCYEIPRTQQDFRLYDIINPDIFTENPIKAYLTEKLPYASLIPHKDNGNVLIFPITPIKYILSYLDDNNKPIYEYEYRVNAMGNVIPILHNGLKYTHTVQNDGTHKWWVQIQLNLKSGGWKELVEQVDNGNFFTKGV